LKTFIKKQKSHCNIIYFNYCSFWQRCYSHENKRR